MVYVASLHLNRKLEVIGGDANCDEILERNEVHRSNFNVRKNLNGMRK